MTDQPTDQEQKYHELSATPFSGSAPEDEQKTTAAEPAQETASNAPEAPAESEDMYSMEAAMAQMDRDSSNRLVKGDVIDGVVVHVDQDGILVDVGTKSEGVIKPGEFSSDPSADPRNIVTVGEKIKVMVLETEGETGGPVLSKRRADFINAWERVENAFEEKSTIKAMVMDRVKGGLVVDLGVRGFVPASHIGSGKVKNLDKYIGQSLPFKIIEVDRERRKVVLSNKLAVEEEEEKLRKETLASIAEGQIREGIVRRITDYGAFVDLGGVDGLLHVSEMSWTRIQHPSEVVKVGQKIQVMVLKLNLAENRVSLGLRQILPDPWDEVRRLHKVGDVITAPITRLVPFGAFVQLEGGVEAIVPNSEISQKRINRPEDVLSVGQVIEAKIIDIRPEERRITLSIKQLLAEKEKEREEAEYKSYAEKTVESGKTTIADLIGAQLGDLASMTEEESKKEAEDSKNEEAEAGISAKAEEALEAQAGNEEASEEVKAEEEAAAPEAAEDQPAVEAEAETQQEAAAEEEKQ